MSLGEATTRRALLQGVMATGATLSLLTPGEAEACAPELLLPQDDPKPERRLAMLEAAREAYRYTYEKPNVRGVAMCELLPPTERPAWTWVLQVGQTLGEIHANEATTNEVPPEKLSRTGLKLCRSGTNAGALLLDLGHSIVVPNPKEGVAKSIEDFKGQFGMIPLPPIAEDFRSDASFCRMRVAGPNPAWMRRIDALPEDFGVTEEHARASLEAGDSLEAARAEGRLFLCAYPELLDLSPGGAPVPPPITLDYAADPAAWDRAYKEREAAYARCERRKTLVAPYALFARPKQGRSIVPVAIQLLPNGHAGASYPVLTPKDGMSWMRAKAMVAAADGTVHEAISHLALTHLVLEAFALAMHNQLAEHHPLHRLLAPHFVGTMLINEGADRSLVAPGSSVDELLIPTAGGSVQLAARGLKDFDFNATMFPNSLKARGLDDPATLPDYPYRDDGRLVWDAIQGWVRGYVERYYSSDAVVQADTELQGFVRELGQYRSESGGRRVGGGLRGVGEEGGVRTRDYLVSMLTQIIFNASAQHAAVNFPQAELMSFTPGMPLATYGPLPEPGDGSDEGALLQQLPTLATARRQLSNGWLLGSMRHTRLGSYSRGSFGDKEIQEGLARFQRELASVEQTISERNRERPHYPYLLPSLIPQATNI